MAPHCSSKGQSLRLGFLFASIAVGACVACLLSALWTKVWLYRMNEEQGRAFQTRLISVVLYSSLLERFLRLIGTSLRYFGPPLAADIFKLTNSMTAGTAVIIGTSLLHLSRLQSTFAGIIH